jgi:hypothetical protein
MLFGPPILQLWRQSYSYALAVVDEDGWGATMMVVTFRNSGLCQFLYSLDFGGGREARHCAKWLNACYAVGTDL